jgi:DNA gyrase subunit A
MGRVSRGVRGISLPAGHEVNALVIVGEGDILTATENGYGKRTPVAEYPLKGRAGQGVFSIQTSARNGRAVGALLVRDSHELMLISNGGTLVRTRAAEVSRTSRNTQGVTLIRLDDGERLVGIARIETIEEEDEAHETSV